MHCLLPLILISNVFIANRSRSLDDEPALRAKVDEALSVYDEYVKARKEEDAPAEANASTNDNEKAEGDAAKE